MLPLIIWDNSDSCVLIIDCDRGDQRLSHTHGAVYLIGRLRIGYVLILGCDMMELDISKVSQRFRNGGTFRSNH